MEALDRKNADGASVSAVGSGSVGSFCSFCGAFLLGVFFAFAPAAKAADIESGDLVTRIDRTMNETRDDTFSRHFENS